MAYFVNSNTADYTVSNVNALGYTATGNVYSNTYKWNKTSLDLDPGSYIVTGNVCSVNSPNTWLYLCSNNSSIPNNIFGGGYSVNTKYSSYQSQLPNPDDDNSPAKSDAGQYAFACQIVRNGASGSNAAMSLSGPVVINNAYSKITLYFYIQTNDISSQAVLTATRIG
jgi:hypothetical protein